MVLLVLPRPERGPSWPGKVGHDGAKRLGKRLVRQSPESDRTRRDADETGAGQCSVDPKNEIPRQPHETLSKCLYNIEDDPKQEHVLSKHNQPRVRRFEAIWRSFQEQRKKALDVDLDPAFIEELQRTGYDFRTKEETP